MLKMQFLGEVYFKTLNPSSSYQKQFKQFLVSSLQKLVANVISITVNVYAF